MNDTEEAPKSKNMKNLFELINYMIRIAQTEVARGAGEESLNLANEIYKAVNAGHDRIEWMDKRVIERKLERELEASEGFIGGTS